MRNRNAGKNFMVIFYEHDIDIRKTMVDARKMGISRIDLLIPL